MSRPESVKKRQREEALWPHLREKLVQAILQPTTTVKQQQARLILRRMQRAVLQKNGGKLLELAPDYIRLTRTLPPCIYALAHPPWKNLYLDGEALDKGLRISSLTLGIVHPQIYR